MTLSHLMRLRRCRHLEQTGQGEDRDLGISLVVRQPRARLEVEEDDLTDVFGRSSSLDVVADGSVLVAQTCRDLAQVEDML